MTYANVITAIAFLLLGAVGHALYEEWWDSRVRKARKHRKLRARKDRDTLRSFDQSVAIGNEEEMKTKAVVKNERNGQPILG